MTRYDPYLQRLRNQRDDAVETLIRWADTNSGSGNLAGLEEMLSILEKDFEVLGGEMSAVDLQPRQMVDEEGKLIRARLGRALSIRKRRTARLKVFLCIHMDTVFQADHPFRKCVRLDHHRLQGPGVADAKGGLLVMLKALEALERSPWADNLGWEALITPDEEIGSPGSAPLLTEAAKNNHIGLVFEPCLPDGSLVGARKGSGNFTAVVRGRAAHAGRSPHEGRNAINALAGFIVELNDVHSDQSGITINVGNIRGGGPVNVVPDLAVGRFNVRVTAQEDRIIVENNLRELTAGINEQDGISLELHGDFARPPKPLEAETLELFRQVAQCGRDLGLSIDWEPSGGACDGNNLVAAGLPTIDSLGPRGGGLHSAQEHVFLDSLVERTRLTALFLMKLAAGDVTLTWL